MPVTVACPICGKTVQIPGYDAITRTDALVGAHCHRAYKPATPHHAAEGSTPTSSAGNPLAME